MMDLISSLIDEIGPGHMGSTAYDTAWAARLGEIDWNLSSHALSWLTENQLPDGSWGGPPAEVLSRSRVMYPGCHDRTLLSGPARPGQRTNREREAGTGTNGRCGDAGTPIGSK